MTGLLWPSDLRGADRQTGAPTERVVRILAGAGGDLKRLVGGLAAINFILKLDDAVSHGYILSSRRRMPDLEIHRRAPIVSRTGLDHRVRNV